MGKLHIFPFELQLACMQCNVRCQAFGKEQPKVITFAQSCCRMNPPLGVTSGVAGQISAAPLFDQPVGCQRPLACWAASSCSRQSYLLPWEACAPAALLLALLLQSCLPLSAVLPELLLLPPPHGCFPGGAKLWHVLCQTMAVHHGSAVLACFAATAKPSECCCQAAPPQS